MSQEQDKGLHPNQPPVARAEEFVDRMGRSIGLFAGLTGQRLQRATTVIRQEVQHARQPTTTPGEKSNQPETAQPEECAQSARPATEKATAQAEQKVDQATQRLALLGAVMSYQVQKTAARIREEAEDMWVEAQHLRHPNGRK
jgi:hypothetical protein